MTVTDSSKRGSPQPVTERIAKLLTDADAVMGFPYGFTYKELARKVYGADDPTPAQLSACRRSVARLVAQGRAEREDGRECFQGVDGESEERGWHWRTNRYGEFRFAALNPAGVVIRRPLTDADREAQTQLRAELEAAA